MAKTEKDYGTIDTPYDRVMNRSAGGTSPATFDSAYQGYEGEQSNAGAMSDKAVSNGQTLENLWIDTFIRSKNWKPGKRGFNIDGLSGDAEFNNVTVRGTIVSSTIEGGSITGTTITAGSVEAGDYVTIDGESGTYTAYQSGVRRVDITTSSVRFYSTAGVLGATITASGSGVLLTASGGEFQVLGDMVTGGGDILPSLDLGPNIGSASLRYAVGYFGVLGIRTSGSTVASIAAGTGDPEGVLTANVGCVWLRTDGGSGTTMYVKETGSGNTGWSSVA